MQKRIVMFAPGLSEVGGAARHSRLLAERLASRGWDVRVITRAGGLRRFHLERSKNLTILEVPGFGRPGIGSYFFLVCALPLGIAWGTRAVSLLALQLMSQAVAASVTSFFVHRPFLALGMGSGELSDVAYASSASFRKFRRVLLRRAAFLLAQSEEMVKEMERLMPREKIAILPNPVRPIPRFDLTGQPNALFVGRFAEEKDLLRLLDAWQIVVRARPDAILTLAGEGGSYRSVEKDVRKRVSENPTLEATVRFTGWVAETIPLLRRADVYVHPSWSEGMSNALLEACVAGRVIVASDISPNKEVLGEDYPLLFRARDIDSLANALREAFENEDARKEARATAVARVRRFEPGVVLDKLERLIEEAHELSRKSDR